MGVQVPCHIHAQYRKKLLFGEIRRHLGTDEETIRTYIKNQEIADKQLDQL
jgi:hypothetical protein